MLSKRKLTALLLATGLLLATPLFARSVDLETPHRFNPRSLDGALVTLVSPIDGTVWSTWAYRNGAEYDIAISFKDNSGFWSEPAFLGRADRVDQIQPAFLMDDSGHLYLAYVERNTGAVKVTALPAGSETWLDPLTVTAEGQRGLSPALAIVANRLVLAYRSGGGLAIADFPLLPGPITGHTINDGFDPFGSSYAGGGDGGNGGGSDGGNGSQHGGSTGGGDSEGADDDGDRDTFGPSAGWGSRND